jgi:hypothetical protein
MPNCHLFSIELNKFMLAIDPVATYDEGRIDFEACLQIEAAITFSFPTLSLQNLAFPAARCKLWFSFFSGPVKAAEADPAPAGPSVDNNLGNVFRTAERFALHTFFFPSTPAPVRRSSCPTRHGLIPPGATRGSD